MLNFLPSPLLGIFSAVMIVLNVLVLGAMILLLALIKFFLPFVSVRRVVDPVLNGLGQAWVGNNSLWMALVQKTNWRVEGLDKLSPQGWYLVTSNHQTWVDILVLQRVFHRRVPFLKFFLKQELILVPVIGLVWWALDFPFMKRYSEAYLKKHPEKRGQDQATTRRACEKFSVVPTSVINFLEGTRFTKVKHDRQGSPFHYLLKPKAGGIALAINAMGEKFQSLLDVTVFYPEGAPSFWDLLSGRVKQIVVLVNEQPIPRDLMVGDYGGDAEFRARMQAWVQGLWQAKDQQLADLYQQYPAAKRAGYVGAEQETAP
ncbi:acyltransferase [Chitinimonas sp. BJB300]|uniref:acyltransferase n=1 Tax=Chitinimonas sp. BJB300 TaxID=1559339 RepID=UPI000C103B55|nr:acyltransferase [Chitinimonas sp. BJB300]PHV11585.1 acyltransferase [Chitinimonas sp. BJB300]TSJ88074.1 acyltransferase [Chitinimonas sp. BJB300]